MACHKHKIKQNVEMGTLKNYSLNSISANSPNLHASYLSHGNPMSLSEIIDKSTISLIAVMVIFHISSCIFCHIFFENKKNKNYFFNNCSHLVSTKSIGIL